MYKDKECNMEGCKNIFTPTTGNQKYCLDCKEKAKSQKDRIRWKNSNRKKNNSVEYNRGCLICGKEFSTFYKKKVYCGSEECEIERLRRKNKVIHKKRSKEKMVLKGKKYYKDNREKCLLNKALAYRNNHPNAKAYVSGKINKHTIDFVREYIENYGYELISTFYINNRSEIELKCPRGHYWKTTFQRFKDSDARCFTCYTKNNYTSRFELEVREFVSGVYSGNVVYNDRTIILNSDTGRFLELDLYFPDINKAIECDGLYWHKGDEMHKKDTFKNNFCESSGIDLLRVTDKEWEFGEGKQHINNFLVTGNK